MGEMMADFVVAEKRFHACGPKSSYVLARLKLENEALKQQVKELTVALAQSKKTAYELADEFFLTHLLSKPRNTLLDDLRKSVADFRLD